METIPRAGGIAWSFKEKPGSLVVVEMGVEKDQASRLCPLKVVYEITDPDNMVLLEKAASLALTLKPMFFGDTKNQAALALLRNFNGARITQRLPTLGIQLSPHAEMPANFPAYQGIINKYFPRLIEFPEDSIVRTALANVELGKVDQIKEEPVVAAFAYATVFLDTRQPIFVDHAPGGERFPTRAVTDDYDPFA